MTRRSTMAVLVLGSAVLAAPAEAQLARATTAAADTPKLLVLPFVRDNADSAMSLVVADGVRDRLRAVHLDKFNTFRRPELNHVLTESGYTPDVPLEPANIRLVARFMNARYLIEGSMIRRPGDSILVVARLAEANGVMPQAATVSMMASAAHIGTGTGTEIANRLVEGYRTFDEVAECRRRLEAGNIAGAQEKAQQALHQYPDNAGAWLCISQILEAQHAPDDSVVGALRNAYTRDTLATAVMRRLAAKYEARRDTANLLDMLKRVLTIDFRDNDLRIGTARLMVQMGQPDSAVRLVGQGLEQNPASVELLGVKAIAMAAGSHWDSAFGALQAVADIDSSKVDSLFIFRITNYARQIPDSTRWLQWVERATQRFPTQLDYWYTLASQKMVRGDSVGAMEAARGLLSNVPPDAATSADPQIRGLFARGHYVVAMLESGHGQVDSAVADADLAVRADSTIRGSVGVVYLVAGAKQRGDTVNPNLPRAIDLLTQARTYLAGNQRLVANASFQLGVSQFQLARQLDQRAEGEHNCEMVRALPPLWAGVEQNVAAGASINRDVANQILMAVPQFRARVDALSRNYHC